MSVTQPDGLVDQSVARRAAWLRLLTQWHWISSALSLVGMLFFASTGIMLNNAEYFESETPSVTRHEGTLPGAVLAEVNAAAGATSHTLPPSLHTWLRSSWDMSIYPKTTEWQADQIYVDLARPGVDASLTIDRHSGLIQYEADDHGWVAFFDDLHKGKNAGRVWSWMITAFGVACLIFCITGLLILQIHSRARWKVWPVAALGLVVPLVLVLIFVH